ncbi:MAG: flagellar basal body rod protein FlgC [Planctomycetes bacterium]|jgi:flagellar basal-body rod protein FlgC|nr:flagellar basal body rod protein FlgC [Planctomycetota bacterium]
MSIGGLSNSMHVAIGGMQAQMTRCGVIATNVANARTTRTPEGGAYRRKDVVFTDNGRPPGGVRVDVVEDPDPTRSEFNPRHPDANADGFVEMPNVDPAREMVDLVQTQNDFVANLAAVKTAQDMYDAAVDVLA